MKTRLILFNLSALLIIGCGNKKESADTDIKIDSNQTKTTRLIAFSKSNLKSENDNTKLFLAMGDVPNLDRALSEWDYWQKRGSL
jgi:hypothetical protein